MSPQIILTDNLASHLEILRFSYICYKQTTAAVDVLPR